MTQKLTKPRNSKGIEPAGRQSHIKHVLRTAVLIGCLSVLPVAASSQTDASLQSETKPKNSVIFKTTPPNIIVSRDEMKKWVFSEVADAIAKKDTARRDSVFRIIDRYNYIDAIRTYCKRYKSSRLKLDEKPCQILGIGNIFLSITDQTILRKEKFFDNGEYFITYEDALPSKERVTAYERTIDPKKQGEFEQNLNK